MVNCTHIDLKNIQLDMDLVERLNKKYMNSTHVTSIDLTNTDTDKSHGHAYFLP